MPRCSSANVGVLGWGRGAPRSWVTSGRKVAPSLCVCAPPATPPTIKSKCRTASTPLPPPSFRYTHSGRREKCLGCDSSSRQLALAAQQFNTQKKTFGTKFISAAAKRKCGPLVARNSYLFFHSIEMPSALEGGRHLPPRGGRARRFASFIVWPILLCVSIIFILN